MSIVKGHAKEWLTVPCGQCDECRSRKSDDWFQRIYAEIEDYNKHGGKAAFVTYTYNDAHLPRFNYIGKDNSWKSFPCFSKLDKDNYVRAFNDYFRIHYGWTNKDKEHPIKFIWCSEYGLTDGCTHRPHYHVIWLLPKELLDKVGYSQLVWKRLFRLHWQDEPYNRGFVRYSPKYDLFVKKEFAGLYVSKYMTKDIDFYHQPEVEEYFNLAVDEHGVKDKSTSKFLLENAKEYLPRHFQSPSLGKCLIDVWNNYDIYRDGLDLGLSSDIKKGTSVKRKIPQYIERKILYTQDNKTRSYKLTEKGVEWKVRKLQDTFKKDCQKYDKLKDLQYLKTLVSPDDLRRSKFLNTFKDREDLHSYITRILENSHISEEVYLYNRVWSGTADDGRLWHQLSFCDHDTFVFLSIQRYYESLYFPADAENHLGVFLDGFTYYPRNDTPINKYRPFNEHPRFKGFEEFMQIVGAVYNIYHIDSNKKYLRDRKLRSIVKYKSA